MAYFPFQPGQQPMSSSQGVVIASDQSTVSVTGTVNIGTIPGSVIAFPVGNQSVSGTVNVNTINNALPTGTNLIGSVVALQGTQPWNVGIVSGSIAATFTPPANQSVSGTVQVDVRSSVAVAIISGSIAATFTPPANQSVSGAVSVSNFPTTQNVSGSVVATQGTTPWVITGSIQGVANQSVSGTITANQGGNAGFSSRWPVILTNGTQTVDVSSASMLSVAVNNTPSISGTVNIGTIPGSVVAFQGTSPWVVQSIVGTYGEDIPSTAADKGLFTLGIRNDTVASLVGTDLDYTGWSTDSAGRHLVKPFVADEAAFTYQGSVVSASVTLVKASAIGKRNYLTDFWATNTGSVAQLLTIQDGSTSILGFTIIPAGGGSNSPGINIPLKTNASQDLAYKVTGTSSTVYLTIQGYQAP